MPTRKLTEEHVRAIRENKEGWTLQQWADKLGVHRNTIVLAKHGMTWSNV